MKLKLSIRNVLYWFVAAFLLLFFSRQARKRMFQTGVITAIVFHNPRRKLFEKVVKWLKKYRFSIISENELQDILQNKKTCPAGAVWITLDDGWKGNLYNVIPVAVEFEFPITIFICTESSLKGTYWWRQVRQHPEALPHGYQTPEIIRGLPDSERKRILESLDTANIHFVNEAMDVQDIKKIVQYPQVSIGGHTASHPILPNCSPEDLVVEIKESKNILETWTGNKLTTFAYPNGSFCGKEVSVLEDAGFKLAVTTVNDSFMPDVDRFQIPRNEMVDEGGVLENICRVLGIWQATSTIYKRKRKR